MKTSVFVFLVLFLPVPIASAQVSDFDRDRLPLTQLNGAWRFHTGDDSGWAQPAFDDSNWALIRPGTSWAGQGYAGYSGFAWYRLRVTLPPQHMPLALYLPLVVNSCEVFANGRLIGTSSGMPPRPAPVAASHLLYTIPPSAIEPGRTLVIAIRVWRWNQADNYTGGGLLAVPSIGQPEVMQRLRTLELHDIFWDSTDMGLNLVFNLLTAIAGLALFALRPKEREYLFFGAAQILWATLASGYYLVRFLTLPAVGVGVLLMCAKTGAQFLNLEFFVTLMRQRRRFLYWMAASAVLLPMLLLIPLGIGWINIGQTNVMVTVFDLVYGICVPALLYRGAVKGNLEARLLIAPYALSFAINVLGDLPSLPGLSSWGWLQALGRFLNAMTDWPFPISAFSAAGDLAMFSVIAVLVLRYARSRQDEERLESELEAARAVQHVLIPEEIPSVPGYQVECVYKPAGQVGGDFFQIIPLPEGEALVAIGDVSGKGMPAAMTVSMVVGMIRTLVRTTQNPAVILTEMNQHMVDRTFGGFTTCLILHIAPDGRVTAANAGHIAPYVGGQEIPVGNGLPLGLTKTGSYAETEFQLSPDDQLTLFTDGVPEARKADGELFGFARAASMSVQPAAEIARVAQQFGQEDDITVLSLVRRPFGQKTVVLAEASTWSAAPA